MESQNISQPPLHGGFHARPLVALRRGQLNHVEVQVGAGRLGLQLMTPDLSF